MSAPDNSSPPESFLKRSILLNVLFVLEGVGTFLQDVVVAASVGLSTQSDILYAAWSLPLTMGRGMFQSLTNSFMGLFDDGRETRAAYDQAITVIGALGILFAGLMSITSTLWFPLTVPGAAPEARLAGQPLAATLSWLIAFLALSETFRAVYYRENKLQLPSIARILGALTTIALMLAFGRSGNLTSFAWSIVAGAALETLINLVGLWLILHIGYRPRWPERTALLEMAQVVGTPLLGQGVRVLAGVGERALASYLGPGALTAVSFASRIVVTLERFVFRGFLITTIQSVAGREAADFNRRFRLVLLFAIPQAVILATLSEPLVGAVFGRGRFSQEDVVLLATALQAYAPAIIGVALTRIPLAVAYGKKQSGVVFGYFVIVSAVLIGIEALGIQLDVGGIRIFGLAYAAALLCVFVWLYYRTILPLNITLVKPGDFIQFAVLGVVVLAGTIGTVTVLARLTATLPLQAWILLLVGSGLALILTIVTMRILQFKEYAWLADNIKKLRA